MKRAILVLLAAILLSSTGSVCGDDYVRLADGHKLLGTYFQTIEFYMLRESVDPTFITSAYNGFQITTSGGATYQIVDITVNPDLPGGFVIPYDTNGTAPDQFLVGFENPAGLPVVEEEILYFTVRVHLGSAAGELCFDSTWLPPSYAWSWSGSSTNITPRFRNWQGEEGSPHCIWIDELLCGTTDFTITPPNDQLIGFAYCPNISFEFSATGGCSPPQWHYRVADGPGWIELTEFPNALYIAPALAPGTYPICVEAMIDFGMPDYCFFDLIIIEEEAPAGDSDCSGSVDIDDVVFLIDYIFAGGLAPFSDPDCSGAVDIDDVVYLIAYIFSGGPAPGDC